jgi:hypothetical protein
MQPHLIVYRSGQLIGYTDADFDGSIVTDGHSPRPATCSNLRARQDPGCPRDRGKWPHPRLMPSTSDGTMPLCICNGSAHLLAETHMYRPDDQY